MQATVIEGEGKGGTMKTDMIAYRSHRGHPPYRRRNKGRNADSKALRSVVAPRQNCSLPRHGCAHTCTQQTRGKRKNKPKTAFTLIEMGQTSGV